MGLNRIGPTGFRLAPTSMTLNGVTTADARYLCWASCSTCCHVKSQKGNGFDGTSYHAIVLCCIYSVTGKLMKLISIVSTRRLFEVVDKSVHLRPRFIVPVRCPETNEPGWRVNLSGEQRWWWWWWHRASSRHQDSAFQAIRHARPAFTCLRRRSHAQWQSR